jgi:predicted lipid-binding transport protein (Tim44 family)
LGAGLIGGLLGYGFFGGMTGLLGVLGFLMQVALVGGLAYLALAWWRSRSQPALAANAPSNNYRQASLNDDQRMPQSGASAAPSSSGGSTAPLQIVDADYASFERLLSVAQLSFSRGDVAALRSATTPEMLGYFTDQLEDNAKRGLRNEVGEPKLISGDLAESWSEPSGEYATVAMRYSSVDVTVEEASGKVVSGSKTVPQEVTEVWTFTRRHGGSPNSWRLSAIQQVS